MISNKMKAIGFRTSINKYIQNKFLSSQFYFATKIMKLPKLGDSISDATIAKYYKRVGDVVNADEVIAEVETDKVNVEIKAEASGVIKKLFVPESKKIDVGADFIEYDTDKSSSPAPPQSQVQAQPEKRAESPKPIQIPEQEVKKNTPAKEEKKPAPIPSPQVMFTGNRGQRIEPISRIRQRIAERLKGSQNNYATLTTFNECDMSEIMNLRAKYGEEFNKKYGIKLGFMSFFLKAATTALMEFPLVNSVIEGENIIYRDFIDISVAVSTPTGLMVPVIRNCESKSFSDFELILRDLSLAARDNKIKIEDMQGGTFTISNGGVYGSMMGTPIINPPQSAILGMHNIVNRPVCRGDEIVARPIMYLALSYDHKLLDGREGVLFLKRIRDLVEEPRKMLVNL